MDLKRYFRGPFVAVLVMLLLFFIVFTYANRGTSYTQVDTSKIVSLITLSPRARLMSTRNCACISVGKPGCGAVVTLTGRSGPGRRKWCGSQNIR